MQKGFPAALWQKGGVFCDGVRRLCFIAGDMGEKGFARQWRTFFQHLCVAWEGGEAVFAKSGANGVVLPDFCVFAQKEFFKPVGNIYGE